MVRFDWLFVRSPNNQDVGVYCMHFAGKSRQRLPLRLCHATAIALLLFPIPSSRHLSSIDLTSLSAIGGFSREHFRGEGIPPSPRSHDDSDRPCVFFLWRFSSGDRVRCDRILSPVSNRSRRERKVHAIRKDCREQSRIRQSIPPFDREESKESQGRIFHQFISKSWEYFVEVASFSLPFGHVDDNHLSKDRRRERAKPEDGSKKSRVSPRVYASCIDHGADHSGDASRDAPPMQVFQEISLYPPVSLRFAFRYYRRYCHLSRYNGKCACASSCNSETVLSAGRFSDRGITAEIALSSSRNERRR